MLEYIPSTIPLIAISSQMDSSSCPLFAKRASSSCILLPTPIPISEIAAFGVPTPTSSTTITLALTDALALAAARRLHSDPQIIFRHNHPGSAIGTDTAITRSRLMRDITTTVQDIPPFMTHLPLEIRRQICESALAPNSTFEDDDSQSPRVKNTNKSGRRTTMVFTCTRIYHEAGTLLYSLNPIHISLNGSSSKMSSSHDPKVLEKEHVFPPRWDAVLSANGEICMPEVTYGDWRKYVSPEK